jgi:PP-loop superfamily ATP-utilizing enzyme
MSRAGTGLPTSGYALVVDGQTKSEFDTHERALKVARDLKGRFPMLQVKVYDAEKKLSETIELGAA